MRKGKTENNNKHVSQISFFSLVISNINLSISNMDNYVDTRKVLLLGDSKESDDNEKTVAEQLHNIFSHIEDLVEVTDRVRKSQVAALYMDPLASPKSEIRIDY